jgi:gamma-glutamyl phosphate reductase
MNSLKDEIKKIGLQAKDASKILAKTSSTQKNQALLAMADHVLKR